MPTPYKIEWVRDSDYYKFSTKQGVCYKIALFRTEKTYFPNHPAIKSFDISFFPEQEHKSKDNEQGRIGLTIAEMVKKLLMDGYVITFSCDTSDNKHRGRDRLFTSWFNKYADHHFRKYDSAQLGDGESVYYVSLLFDVRKYSQDTIEQAFQETIDEYASYKNT